MHRRVALVGALLIAVAACQSRPSSRETVSPNTVDVPQSRQEALTWSRAIDPCALVDRQVLASLGNDLQIGVSSGPSVCDAVVGGGPERGGAEVMWFIGPTWLSRPPGQAEVVEIDGKQVHRTDRYMGLSSQERAELGENGCDYFIPYGTSVQAILTVSTASGTQACSPGEPLVRSMLANVARQPKQGTSPDTAITALTGTATPCVVVPQLEPDHRVEFTWEGQMNDKCTLTADGAHVEIGFEYRERATIPVQARQQEYDRYTGFEYERHGDTVVDLVVGEEFSGVQDRRSARLVPIVTVQSPKPVVSRAVAAAVLPHLPR
ncbi:hypothetical protein AB0E01_09035 [Nocardia vinacea]|uniref:hypothetical protein n=1 Tax=Nocardia vinacea TaxID=96468 RepID=UPI0033FD0E19